MQTEPRGDSAHRPQADILTPLILDFLAWLAPGPKPYADVMEAWRTSCPRLTIWEDAVDQGLVVREASAGSGAVVRLTPGGRRALSTLRG